MKCTLLALATAGGLIAAATPTTPVTTPTATSMRHCQIPCGIYGDMMRIDMLMEDAATIEKGMKSMQELVRQDVQDMNQIVRWTMNKDEHAQKIQDQAAAYWLAQRIKTPAEGAAQAVRAEYYGQLEVMHRIIVAAMKCKQTTDVAHVETLRKLAMKFSKSYFSPADQEHLRQRHGAGEHEDHDGGK